MSKHTPGPWLYIKGDEWSHSVVTKEGELPNGSPSYWTVASINKRREPEHESNAHLIAAAPAMLQALERLIASDDAHATIHAPDGDDVARMLEYAAAFDNARAAIKAAKGEA